MSKDILLRTEPTIGDPAHQVRLIALSEGHPRRVKLAGTRWQRFLIRLLARTINWEAVGG